MSYNYQCFNPFRNVQEDAPGRRELRRALYQAIKKQFGFVPDPIKIELKRLSPPQLESVIDILPQFASVKYLTTHIQELPQMGITPGDRGTPREPVRSEYAPQPEGFSDSVETAHAYQPPAHAIPVFAEPAEPEAEPVQSSFAAARFERITDDDTAVVSEPVELPSSSEPAPVSSSRPVVSSPPVQPRPQPYTPLPPATKSMTNQPHYRSDQYSRSDVVRSTLQVTLDTKTINLVFEFDKYSDAENQRGIRFLLSIDENELIFAQFLAQRNRIEPLEARVAAAIQAYFRDAEKVLSGAVAAQAQPSPVVAPAPVSAPAPIVEAPAPAPIPVPVVAATPVEVLTPVTDTDDADAEAGTDDLSTSEKPRRHRRTNAELQAAGVKVEKRTRLTPQSIDLNTLKFDPRMASILSFDEAKALNIAAVGFIPNSTDVLTLFVEPEGKVRIYTFFNRVTNRAALAALIGIPSKDREKVKIRTLRVPQEFLDEFLADGAAAVVPTAKPTPIVITEESDDPSKPPRRRFIVPKEHAGRPTPSEELPKRKRGRPAGSGK
ncbi:MAG TPA: hypothetical protein PLB32_07200 [Acidobacteriota bacterium]|nr:hypothetical protein [Acidobacteriota bacterium]HNB70835.1 hypothetical protein [Acidobacteriota bacterium]HNG92565.1 hypothetical protein [Acidobacteriota bacterium]HNH81689.1 hypothetical protein [Acidobacteriota bacterium]